MVAFFAARAWAKHNRAQTTTLTAPATRGDLEDTVTATGTLQPKEYVDVGTQVSGQLRRLLVDVGAVVRQGDLLAEIDPSVYQSKVDADEAQLRNQTALLTDRQAQRALAALQQTRQQNMMRDEATTTEAVQTAEADLKSAGAQVDSLKAQMQQTESTLRGDQANLGYTKIHAPMAGTVVSLASKQGQTLNANQQAPIVLRIADLSTMTVQAQVSEADVSKLHVGMDVYFTTLGADRRDYRKLRQIPRAQVTIAESREQELALAYRRSVLAALADVESALSATSHTDEQVALQMEVLEQSRLALKLAEVRYREGADDLLVLLDAQRTLFQAEDQLRQLRLAQLQASIDLFKALGGGWVVPAAS